MELNTDYDIGKAFASIEDELIASMIRNMESHRAEETKEGIQWSQWQTEQLKALEQYRQGNAKKFNKRFSSLNEKIDELIRQQRAAGNSTQEIAILNAIKKGFPAKKASPGAAAEFFKLNDRKLDALIKATTSDMRKAETAILRMANDQYRKVIFNAQVYANTGAGTYEQAVDMSTKNMLSSGLNCVEYANGARHTLSAYAYMAIQTASKRAYLQGEGEKRQEWGISTVIMNKRGNPCPKCLPFVGKVLIDDVWSGGEASDGLYPLMSAAVAAGLYHPRCRDSHTTYFEGISAPPDDNFTEKELREIEESGRREARQRYASRQSERFARLADNSLDPENKKKYRIKEKQWKNGSESGIIKSNEMYRKNNSDLRDGFKFISGGVFDRLTIQARKNGATILHGTEEIEQHLTELGAAASNIGDVLLFRKDVCISEVLEETYHFEQNRRKMNDGFGEPLRTILNEIDAKKYLLQNSKKYKIPRNEIELTQRQLKSYEKQLESIEKEG